jgi:hypothetical protein
LNLPVVIEAGKWRRPDADCPQANDLLEAVRQIEVKRHLAAQGVYARRQTAFGCDVVAGRLVLIEQEQATLAEMVAMRAAGKSLREIGQRFGIKQATTVKAFWTEPPRSGRRFKPNRNSIR